MTGTGIVAADPNFFTASLAWGGLAALRAFAALLASVPDRAMRRPVSLRAARKIYCLRGFLSDNLRKTADLKNAGPRYQLQGGV
jgi:hypothetical protein